MNKKEKMQPLVEEKIKFLEQIIKDLKDKEKILFSLSGKVIKNLDLEIKFQEERLNNIKKFKNSTVEEIEAQISFLSDDMTKVLKYKNLRGVPDNIIKRICFIEDLELIIGTHPNV